MYQFAGVCIKPGNLSYMTPKIKQILILTFNTGQKVIGLGEDSLLYEWDHATATWRLNQKDV